MEMLSHSGFEQGTAMQKFLTGTLIPDLSRFLTSGMGATDESLRLGLKGADFGH